MKKLIHRDRNYFRCFGAGKTTVGKLLARELAGVLLKVTIFIRREISKKCAAVIL